MVDCQHTCIHLVQKTRNARQYECGECNEGFWVYWNDPCDRILKLIRKHEQEAEQKAQKSHDKGKFIMYGYWKAIGVHMRKLHREFKKLGGE